MKGQMYAVNVHNDALPEVTADNPHLSVVRFSSLL